MNTKVSTKFMSPVRIQIKSCLLTLSTLLAVLVLSGCWNRGRQFSSGQLEVAPGQNFELRDQNGHVESFNSGPVELNYQDQGITRNTSLFVFRSQTTKRGILFELPMSSFTSENDFSVKAKTVNQKYDIKGERNTENLGHRIYQANESCSDWGVCCISSIRTVTDSKGNSTTESYLDCGLHSNCPGDRDVELRDDDYIDHFYIHFHEPKEANDAAKYHGQGKPYTRTVKLRNLSKCRT